MLEWAVAAHLSPSLIMLKVESGPVYGREARAPHPAGSYSKMAQQLCVLPAPFHTDSGGLWSFVSDTIMRHAWSATA